MTNARKQSYTGRRWIVAAQNIWGLRYLLNQSLRRSTPFRAMLLPAALSLGFVWLARFVLLLGRGGFIPLSLSVTLGVAILWPAALGAALGCDLVMKEHKFRRETLTTGQSN